MGFKSRHAHALIFLFTVLHLPRMVQVLLETTVLHFNFVFACSVPVSLLYVCIFLMSSQNAIQS